MGCDSSKNSSPKDPRGGEDGCQYNDKVFPDGSRYEGQWKDGQKHGKGCFTYAPDGDTYGDTYDGEWLHGKAHGHGTYTSKQSRYVGEWQDDAKHGQATETWNDTSKYDGTYVRGQKHGKGCFKWPDGSVYDGNFRNNNVEGQGTFTWHDGRQYKGQWLDNKMHGEGRYSWPDGRVYEGQFVEDLKEGEGSFSWSDGLRYTGQWKNGKMHGDGIWRTVEGNDRQGFPFEPLPAQGSPCAELAGAWVPTRVDEWKGCPVPIEQRLATYRYLVHADGTWVDELAPEHHGRVNTEGCQPKDVKLVGTPSPKARVWEGYGLEPGRFKAQWTLQDDGVLKLVWGESSAIYYVVRVGDPRASRLEEFTKGSISCPELLGEWRPVRHDNWTRPHQARDPRTVERWDEMGLCHYQTEGDIGIIIVKSKQENTETGELEYSCRGIHGGSFVVPQMIRRINVDGSHSWDLGAFGTEHWGRNNKVNGTQESWEVTV